MFMKILCDAKCNLVKKGGENLMMPVFLLHTQFKESELLSKLIRKPNNKTK